MIQTFEPLQFFFEFVTNHVWPFLLLIGGGIVAVYKFYFSKRFTIQRTGAGEKLAITRSEDDRFSILDKRLDEMAADRDTDMQLIRKLQTDVIGLEKHIASLELQLDKFRRFVKAIKTKARDVYDAHKHELD